MKTLSVAQFKAQFGHIVEEQASVLVRKRRRAVGVWQPLRLGQLKAKQGQMLRGFVRLGQSLQRDIARRHDEWLYGARL